MRNRFLAAALAAALTAAASVSADAGPISSYPAATTPLSGSETVIGAQAGSTVQITAASIAAIVTAATNSWAGVQTFPAPGASHGSVVLTPGTASGTPPNGSLWTTSSGLYFQAGGATQQAVGNGANTWSGVQTFPAPSGSNASIVLTPGSAPTTPANGSLWTTSSGLFAEVGGVADQFVTNGANSWSGKQSFAAATTAAAGVNLGQGSGPASPANGDLWITSSGVFADVNGSIAALAVTVPTAAAGGSNTQLQYNCSGVLCGATGFGYASSGHTLTGPDGSTWSNTGVTMAGDLNLNGTAIASGSTPVIWAPPCEGATWLIGPDMGFCAHATTGGTDNIGIGTIVFGALTTGFGNVAVGSENAKVLTSGGYNTLVGFEAGHILTTGTANEVLGSALDSEETGSDNVAIGQGALQDQDGASSNVGIGGAAGQTISTGSNEIVIGEGAGPTLTSGNKNILIGISVGYGIATGHGNVAIGGQFATLTDQNDSVTLADGDGNVLAQYLTGNGYLEIVQPVKIDGKFIRLGTATVSALATGDPSPSAGDRAFVTDAATCTFGSTLTGGGSTKCPVYYDGSTWKAG